MLSGLLSLLLWALLSSQPLNIRSYWEPLKASSLLYLPSLWRSLDPWLSTSTTYLPPESFPVGLSGWDLPPELPTHVSPGIPVEYAVIISDLTCLNQTSALPPQTAPPAALAISVNTNSILPGAQGKGLEVILDSFFSFIHTFQFSRKFS